MEISLGAGSPVLEFRVLSAWREIGSPTVGVPMLKIAFPVNVTAPTATYEIPFGSIRRPANGREVPALKWADLSGECASGGCGCGITMVNGDKYGHNADGNTLQAHAHSIQLPAGPASGRSGTMTFDWRSSLTWARARHRRPQGPAPRSTFR